jgi:hypothetical protein
MTVRLVLMEKGPAADRSSADERPVPGTTDPAVATGAPGTERGDR